MALKTGHFQFEAAEGDSRGNVVVKHIRRPDLEERFQVGEQLLPGIPNEITLDLVAPKLPWTAFHMLVSVSRGWQQAIQSHQVYDARVRTKSTQTVVVINDTDHSSGEGGFALYSLSDGFIYYLPQIPGLNEGILWSCHCPYMDGKLYAVGGVSSLKDSTEFQVSAKVYVLDLAVGARSWRQCANMAEPRAHFGCGVINEKIYVFGGTSNYFGNPVYCGSEVYDPATDVWSPIAPAKSSALYYRVVPLGEELFVHRPGLAAVMLEGEEGVPLEVYNPLKNQWRIVDSFICYEEILLLVGGNLHKLGVKVDRLDNAVFDVCAKSWIPKPPQSSSFSDLGSSDSITVMVIDVVVADNEILALVFWKNLQEDQGHPARGICLVRSQGFGSQNKEIVWQKAQCSVPLYSARANGKCGFLGTIQV